MNDFLTARQAAVLAIVRSHVAELGCAPTHKEIGVALGIRSMNGVAKHLEALDRKGYLRLANNNKPRGIMLLDKDGPQVVNPRTWRVLKDTPPNPGAAVIFHSRFGAQLPAAFEVYGTSHEGRVYLLAAVTAATVYRALEAGFVEWTPVEGS